MTHEYKNCIIYSLHYVFWHELSNLERLYCIAKKREKYYEALVNRDNDYIGNCYAAVQTTNIYCDIACPCRNPLTKNTLFFKDISSCISLGYRECKVCKPLSSKILRERSQKKDFFYNYVLWLEASQFPPKSYREHLFNSLEELNGTKVLFQKYLNISLGKYIRLKRSNYILNEDNLDDTHYNKIFFSYINTPLGEMVACDSTTGLCLLEFTDRKMLETELSFLKTKLSGYFVKSKTAILSKATKQLDEYFSQEREIFDVNLDLLGTDFQKNVWKNLLNIPYGDTCSYLEQAINFKNKKLVRAVANANGKNIISIIIPCHRVIGNTGKMVGYGGGVDRKRKLLILEGRNPNI